MALIQLSWGWLNAKRACKAPSVLVELLNGPSHYWAPSTERRERLRRFVRSKSCSHYCSAVSGIPEKNKPWQPCCERGLRELFPGRWERKCVWGMDGWLDGWIAVAHNPAHNTPPQAMLSEVSLHLPLSPSSSTNGPSVARRSESLRRFNYSPGEDDSLWLNSLEKEGEEKEEEEEEEEEGDEKKRRRGTVEGKWRRRRMRRGEESWQRGGNEREWWEEEEEEKRFGWSVCCAVFGLWGECGGGLPQVKRKMWELVDEWLFFFSCCLVFQTDC